MTWWWPERGVLIAPAEAWDMGAFAGNGAAPHRPARPGEGGHGQITAAVLAVLAVRGVIAADRAAVREAEIADALDIAEGLDDGGS